MERNAGRAWAWGALLGAGVLVAASSHDDEFAAARAEMVEAQVQARGVVDPRVLEAMRRVPRHRFVPDAWRSAAYADRPLPIGNDQTISQPYIVAAMTEAVAPRPEHHVLEIGTGSGYQAAVLSRLVRRVTTIEIVPELAESARRRLEALGYSNVTVRTGDGWKGHPEGAPYDGIVVTAAPTEVPPALVTQLGPGARMVIPVGGWSQELRVLTRTESGVETRVLFPVRFVPFTRDQD